MISNQQWRYFLSIDNDLLNLSRFIEITPDNYGVYSIELVRLYLTICSEVDTLMKSLCSNSDQQLYEDALKGTNGKSLRPNMDIYRRFLNDKFPKFQSIQIEIPAFQMTFTPWEAYATESNPSWWSAHNDVKHQRDRNYQKANLENVLKAAAGLLIVNLYNIAWDKNPIIDNLQRPELFEIPGGLCHGGTSWFGESLIIPERIKT